MSFLIRPAAQGFFSSLLPGWWVIRELRCVVLEYMFIWFNMFWMEYRKMFREPLRLSQPESWTKRYMIHERHLVRLSQENYSSWLFSAAEACALWWHWWHIPDKCVCAFSCSRAFCAIVSRTSNDESAIVQVQDTLEDNNARIQSTKKWQKTILVAATRHFPCEGEAFSCLRWRYGSSFFFCLCVFTGINSASRHVFDIQFHSC